MQEKESLKISKVLKTFIFPIHFISVLFYLSTPYTHPMSLIGKSYISIYILKLILLDLPKNVTQLTLDFHNSQKSIKTANELITSSN